MAGLRAEKVIPDEVHKVNCVFLNIIDTPGLSDSSNSKERDLKDEAVEEEMDAETDSDKKPKVQRMTVVDERHKLGILVALMEAQEIHAICFVIRRSSNYGGSLQQIIHGLIDIFDLSFGHYASRINYHFVHTQIDPSDRFSDPLAAREKCFNQFAGIDAHHHFLDNVPSQNDAIACYFVKTSLANFLHSLSKSTGAYMGELKYPKLAGHIRNENELMRALGMVKVSYKDDISDIERQLSPKKNQRIVKLDRRKLYEAKLSGIKAEIKKFDNVEEIEVNRGKCTAEAAVWSSKCCLTVTSDNIVNHSTTSTGGKWDEVTQTDERVTGTLTADWWKEARGSIIVYSRSATTTRTKSRTLKRNETLLTTKLPAYRLRSRHWIVRSMLLKPKSGTSKIPSPTFTRQRKRLPGPLRL